jgi:hypothetical protein
MYQSSYRAGIGADDPRKYSFPGKDEGKEIKEKFDSSKQTQPLT